MRDLSTLGFGCLRGLWTSPLRILQEAVLFGVIKCIRRGMNGPSFDTCGGSASVPPAHLC